MNQSSYEELTGLYRQYVMPTYAPELMFTRGSGARLWDSSDRRYLDFAAGISVCNLGHCHPRVTAAIQEQAAKLVHVSNLYLNDVTPRLAAKLVRQGFDGAVFFCNSGAEANEGMIKFARKHGSARGRYEIVTMTDSFHGRTLATLAATGRSKYRKGFEPDMPGFIQVPFNDFAALRAAVGEKTCAVMLEPVQGEGGILPADRDYLRQVRELCDREGVLLLFDEVQCGMGRLGAMFAYQYYGVEPDAVSLAKALANGFPMGAFIVRRQYAGVLTVGSHASTFGGTPLAAAAALAVQEAFEAEKVLENCRTQGEYLLAELRKICAPYSFVKTVRGVGLMLGVVLECEAAPLSNLLRDRGLITLTAGETVLRLLPPLIITRSEADEALGIIAAGLRAFAETKNKDE